MTNAHFGVEAFFFAFSLAALSAVPKKMSFKMIYYTISNSLIYVWKEGRNGAERERERIYLERRTQASVSIVRGCECASYFLCAASGSPSLCVEARRARSYFSFQFPLCFNGIRSAKMIYGMIYKIKMAACVRMETDSGQMKLSLSSIHCKEHESEGEGKRTAFHLMNRNSSRDNFFSLAVRKEN